MQLGDNENFQTPLWVIKRMLSEIPQNTKKVLEPTPGSGQLVNEIKKKYDCFYPLSDYFDMKHKEKYDCVVMNPPFSPMKKGYEILYDVMNKSDYIIAVMPWLTLINGQKRLQDILTFGLKKIIHLPRSAFKGARVQTCIIVMDKKFIGTTTFETLNKE